MAKTLGADARPGVGVYRRLALIVMMSAGRLEIVTILVLAAALIVAPRRRRNH